MQNIYPAESDKPLFHHIVKDLQLQKLGDLDNPERIKTLIRTSQISESRKELLTDSYDYYMQYKDLTRAKPRFTREDKPIYVARAQLIKYDVTKQARLTQTLGLKHPMGRVSAKSLSMKTIEKELMVAVKKAATKLKQNRTKLLKPEKPIKVTVTFRRLILLM